MTENPIQRLDINLLTAEIFADFGDVLEVQDKPTVMINQGNCARYTNLAQLEFSDGVAGISIFKANPYSSPLTLNLMERHPLGSQAFLPLSNDPFLVFVASDQNGKPGIPTVFLTNGAQGVNYHCNTWHGVLTPIQGNGLFAVVDRIGPGANLQEYYLPEPYSIVF